MDALDRMARATCEVNAALRTPLDHTDLIPECDRRRVLELGSVLLHHHVIQLQTRCIAYGAFIARCMLAMQFGARSVVQCAYDAERRLFMSPDYVVLAPTRTHDGDTIADVRDALANRNIRHKRHCVVVQNPELFWPRDQQAIINAIKQNARTATFLVISDRTSSALAHTLRSLSCTLRLAHCSPEENPFFFVAAQRALHGRDWGRATLEGIDRRPASFAALCVYVKDTCCKRLKPPYALVDDRALVSQLTTLLLDRHSHDNDAVSAVLDAACHADALLAKGQQHKTLVMEQFLLRVLMLHIDAE
jgi:hypothetical protein